MEEGIECPEANSARAELKEESKKEPASKAIAIAVVLGIISGAIGYGFSFVSEHRKSQLQRTNTQIEKIYGPLYALSIASRRAYSELHHLAGRSTNYFDDDNPPDAEQVELWRRWMKTVFMPINLKMEAAILDNSQLVAGNKISQPFIDLIAHVESYKATIAHWKDTDDLKITEERLTARNRAVIVYPVDLDACIRDSWQAILAKRAELEKSWAGLWFKDTEFENPISCNAESTEGLASSVRR